MAYRFNGTTQDVRFALGTALTGYQGPFFAVSYLKRNAISAWHGMLCIQQGVTTTVRADILEIDPSNQIEYFPGAGVSVLSLATYTDITNFEMIGVSGDTSIGANTVRFHTKVGAAAWTHTNAGSATTSTGLVWTSGDHLIVGTDASGSDRLSGDVVCTGIRKSIPSDVTIEAMCSTTDFTVWQAASFDWLIGFDAITTRNDQTSGAGNESSRNGTPTLVSDPAGWVWTAGAVGGRPILVPNSAVVRSSYY